MRVRFIWWSFNRQVTTSHSRIFYTSHFLKAYVKGKIIWRFKNKKRSRWLPTSSPAGAKAARKEEKATSTQVCTLLKFQISVLI